MERAGEGLGWGRGEKGGEGGGGGERITWSSGWRTKHLSKMPRCTTCCSRLPLILLRCSGAILCQSRRVASFSMIAA